MIECIDNGDDSRIKALLLFKKEELLYDVKNLAYVEGHILPEEDNEIRHTLQDIGERGNIDRVIRVFDKAHAILTEALYPFTKRDLIHDVLDDRLLDREVFGIGLNLPSEFSQTTLNLMERLIHEYLVCDVLQDWLSITNTKKAQVWIDKREEAKAQLRQCVTLRRGRKKVRIRPHWF